MQIKLTGERKLDMDLAQNVGIRCEVVGFLSKKGGFGAEFWDLARNCWILCEVWDVHLVEGHLGRSR